MSPRRVMLGMEPKRDEAVQIALLQRFSTAAVSVPPVHVLGCHELVLGIDVIQAAPVPKVDDDRRI